MNNGTWNGWGSATGANPFSREAAGPNAGLGEGWARERVSYAEQTQEFTTPLLQPTPSLPDTIWGPPEATRALPEATFPQYAPVLDPAPAHSWAPPSPQPPGTQAHGFGQPRNFGIPDYGDWGTLNPYLPAPAPSVAAPAYAPLPGHGYGPGYYQGWAPLRTAPFAVASLVMSLAGLLISLTAPLGVLFGVVGLWQVSRNPYEYKGRGIAWTGIVIGGLWTALLVLVFWWLSTL